MVRMLLLPFAGALRHRFFPGGRLSPRGFAVCLLAVGLVAGLFLATLAVVGYFYRQNELGAILSIKILQMAWILLFAMQVFSCMVSAVSSFFLSQDNEIVFAAPVPERALFAMRFVTTTAYTSWMMVVFALPVFGAYGVVFHAGLGYWPLVFLCLAATGLAASATGCLGIVCLVRLFPARRTKDIVMYLSLCFGLAVYFVFRLLRPEELVNPEQFGRFIEYLSALSAPAAPWLPPGWAAEVTTAYLLDGKIDLLSLGVLLLTPPALYIFGEWAMQRWFFTAWTRAVESFGGHRRFRRPQAVSPLWRQIWRKEFAGFVRDSAEWSQLFMIAALIVVYLYNFKLLPVERALFATEYITNLVSFANIGLAAFVIIALSARFVYPSVSAEGGVFPLVQAAPVRMIRYLLAKYLFYAAPFALLAVILVAVTDYLLGITGPMWFISLATSQLVVWTVVALALGLGGVYADFKAESRAAVAGSFGAIVFLLVAAGYAVAVIFGAAWPAYRLVRRWLRQEALSCTDSLILAAFLAGATVGSFVLAAGLLRRAAARLEGRSRG